MTQKKIIAIVLLCALTAACSKDETGGSGNGSSSGRRPVATAHKYTYGYFHPEKKVKKIVETRSWGNDSTVCEFTWTDNNLLSIKTTEYNTYSDPSITTYSYHYGGDGYVDRIITKQEGRIHSDTTYYTYMSDEVRYYEPDWTSNHTSGMGYTFGADGNLTACHDYPVTYGTDERDSSTVSFYEHGSIVEWEYWDNCALIFPLQGLLLPKGYYLFNGYLNNDVLYALRHCAIPTNLDNLLYDEDGYITEVEYNDYTHRFIY